MSADRMEWLHDEEAESLVYLPGRSRSALLTCQMSSQACVCEISEQLMD